MEARIDSGVSSQLNTETLPNFIYVSELLRTWETAVLLFLNGINIELTLFISPFLRETGPISFPSDNPGDLKEQFREFIRFISFLRYLKKLKIDNISNLIPHNFIIYLKHFNGPFPHGFTSDIDKQEGVIFGIVSTMSGGQDAPNECILIEFRSGEIDDQGSTSDKPPTNQAILSMLNIISQGLPPTEQLDYCPYNSDRPTGLNFPHPSPPTKKAIGNMITPSEPAGSLVDFLDWYKDLKKKPHSESNIHNSVFIVSHSGTLKKFIKSVISNSDTKPSKKFLEEYNEAMETNTFSLVVKVDGIPNVFNVFRHAYSCDNRYMDKGLLSLRERVKAGGYTNLALWGILSTLIFSNNVIHKLVNKTKDIDAESVSVSVLQICRGVGYEPDSFRTDTYDKYNMLCGEQYKRMGTKNFILVFGHCGTSSLLTRTLDNNCIKLTMTDVNSLASGSKVVLFLDKTNKIEARFFHLDTSRNYSTKFALTLATLNRELITIISHIIKQDKMPDSLNEYIQELKDEITGFINSNLSDERWNGRAWKKAWYTLIGKELEEDEWVTLTGEDLEEDGRGGITKSSALPEPGEIQGQHASPWESDKSFYLSAGISPDILPDGGTIKKTRRHRHKHKKYKVMKKYTRKNKKYKPKPTKKFKRTQKHKKIHKYRSRKYRK
jgi:hypothetical protein